MRNKSSTLTVKKEKKGSVECSSISCLLKKAVTHRKLHTTMAQCPFFCELKGSKE